MPNADDLTVDHLDAVLSKCEQFISSCTALSPQVNMAAAAFTEDGIPFEPPLLDELTQFAEGFERDVLERLPAAFRGKGPRDVAEAVRRLIAGRGIERILADAERLEYTRGSFTALDQLLSEIPGLRAKPHDVEPERLRSMEALLRLVREGASLTDAECAELMDVTARRTSALLALAASRGHLRFRAEKTSAAPEPAALPPMIEPPAAEIVPEPIVEEAPSVESAPMPESEEVPSVEEIRPPPDVPVLSEAFVAELELTPPEAVAAASTDDPPVIEPTEQEEEEVLVAIEVNAPDAALVAAPASAVTNPAVTIPIFLRAGEYALAYQLAAAVEASTVESVPGYPSWLLRAVTLAPFVLQGNGRIAQSLRDAYEQFSDQTFYGLAGDDEQNLRCLVAAACLRPTVIAPESGAPDVLSRIYPDGALTPVYDVCRIIAEFGALHIGAELSALGETASEQAWFAEFKRYDKRVTEFLDRAGHQIVLFAAGSFVWKQLTKPGGEIYEILAAARRLDKGSREQLQAALSEFPNRGSLEKLIRRTDREKVGRRVGKDIEGTALSQLIMKVEEAFDLARIGLALEEQRPNSRPDFVRKRIANLVQAVHDSSPAAVQALESVKDRLSAASVLISAIQNLKDLLSAQQFVSEEPWPEICLAVPLLRAGIRPTDGWAAPPPDEVLALHPKSVTASWPRVFRMLCDEGDHRATGLLLTYCEAAGVLSPGNLTQLQAQRKEAIDDRRYKLKQECRRYCDAIEDAMCRRILGETERDEMLNQVIALDQQNDRGDVLDFRHTARQLDEIDRALSERESAERERALERLAALNLSGADLQRIRGVIASGNVLAANEYFDMLHRGTSLPPVEDPKTPFESFFPETTRSIEELASKIPPQQIIHAVKTKQSIFGVQLTVVPGGQRDHAADMLEAWFSLKARGQGDSALVQRVFSGVGFPVLRVERPPGQRTSTFDVITDVIADRTRCPVPQYGSQAGGKYRVHLVFGRPAAEDLVANITDGPAVNAQFVLYFGRLTELMRRELAAHCRRLQRTVLVIDEILMLYLCGFRSSHLPVTFACTLPFTHLEPYVTSASFVPVEMFYGREDEKEDLIKPTGSCFVYGGRQLGKTALLRHVERSFHHPEEGQVAKWIDLNEKRVGFERPTEDIWGILADALRRDLEIPASVTKAETFVQYVDRWLAANPHRRVLLLLDEADRFLQKDAESEFLLTSVLKGVMDRSNRRFKVVYAGLHNVQRLTKLANHPLAHYGRPICVGPLLDAGDLKEGRALVVEPLKAIGYEFESPDLVTTILSQTNYYPSLIQLYCEELLRHVAVGQKAKEKSPPWVITAKHVEDAYRSRTLRKQIHDRFVWTLHLDPRYEVLAYTIAYGYLSEGRTEFPLHWIDEQVRGWWKEGFHGVDREALRTILDEMIGLGILRSTLNGAYSLRNLNIVQLMGSAQDIEAALLQEREMPTEYEPSSYRSNLGGIPRERRSPLTVQQEGEILSTTGVFVAVACEAAGNDALAEALVASAAMHKTDAMHLKSADDVARFLDEIGSRTLERSLVTIVACGCWSPEQVTAAAEKTARLRSRKNNFAVVFVADPPSTWDLLTASKGREALENTGVRLVTARPWHDTFLGKWLDDLQAPSDRESRVLVRDGTGNWPRLIDQLLRQAPDARLWVARLRDGWRPSVAPSLFGISKDVQTAVLRNLSELESAPASDLAELYQGDRSEAQRVIEWAEIVGLTESDDDGALVLNPSVRHLFPSA